LRKRIGTPVETKVQDISCNPRYAKINRAREKIRARVPVFVNLHNGLQTNILIVQTESMKLYSIPLVATLTCALACTDSSAITLADFKCENSVHKVECIIPTDLVAMPKALVLPVFAEKPADHVTSFLFIDSQGRVAGAIGGKTQEKKALSDSLKLSEFLGAQLFGTGAWCCANYTAEAYFYVEQPVDNSAQFEAPFCTFRLESVDLIEIKASVPATETDDKPVLQFEFTVNKNGKTVSITTLNDRDKKILEKYFLPKIGSFVFTPAKLDGKPVDTKLILSIDGIWAKPEGETSQPSFCQDASSQPQIKLAKPYAGDPLKIKCFLTFSQDGTVESVRLPDSVSTGLAIVIMNKVRTWKNPVHFDWDCKLPIGVVEFDATPNSSDITLAGEARPIKFSPPKILKQANFIRTGLVIDSFDKALYKYTVDVNGKLQDISIVNKSNDKFADRMKNTILESTYQPASVEDSNVECMIEELSGLKIGEYWANTDSLKW
jgi:hypothetical protein